MYISFNYNLNIYSNLSLLKRIYGGTIYYSIRPANLYPFLFETIFKKVNCLLFVVGREMIKNVKCMKDKIYNGR